MNQPQFTILLREEPAPWAVSIPNQSTEKIREMTKDFMNEQPEAVEEHGKMDFRGFEVIE